MGKFNDLISTVGVGDDGVTVAYPENFLADIDAAYGEDMGLADSRVSVLEADNAALTQKNLELQAEMYELIKQIPATGDAPEGDATDDDSDDDSDDTPDIFGEPEYK